MNHHGEQKFISSLAGLTGGMGTNGLEQQQSTILLTAGVIRDERIHLTQIQDVLQIRPSFHESTFHNEIVEDMKDDEDGEGEREDGNDDNRSKGDVKKNLQQVQMRRKENERNEASRLHSYTYCKGREEAESWIPLEIHSIDSAETEERFESLYHSVVIATDTL